MVIGTPTREREELLVKPQVLSKARLLTLPGIMTLTYQPRGALVPQAAPKRHPKMIRFLPKGAQRSELGIPSPSLSPAATLTNSGCTTPLLRDGFQPASGCIVRLLVVVGLMESVKVLLSWPDRTYWTSTDQSAHVYLLSPEKR